jgi:selenide, water dikinase
MREAQVQHQIPFVRDIVLIGGGHTHALVLHMWAMNPLAGARLTVINPAPTAPYTGMLPGFIAGHYARDDLDIDLVRLCRRASARLVLGKASAIDRAARTVTVAGRPPIAYDVCSVDIGITSDLPMIPGYLDHAASAKPLGTYAQRWDAWLAQVASGALAPQIAIIGGGVAGVELALAMAHRVQGQGASVTVLEAAKLLPNIGPDAARRLRGHLDRYGVQVLEQASVTEVTAQGVTLADGRVVEATLVVGAAGSRPQDWLATTGLNLTQGYITVDPFLRSVTDPTIFAVGDCAHMAHAPRAKAGVYAVRQAPFLFQNLRAACGAGQMRAYQPQRDYLKLVSLGGRTALADKWNLPLEGAWLWRLKDRIDAKFMGQFRDPRPMPPALPQMRALDPDAPADNAPLCGGCGAKLGARALAQALRPVARDDILGGIGDDAAIVQVGDAVQVLATDHLRAMVDDPYLMGQIAANHALGDIWAMGAAPRVALVNITLPRMSPTLQTRTLAEVMAGIDAALSPAGVAVVGGHSTMGAELQIGLTLTGTLVGAALRKSGAQAGDALILTKALGTGVIMAAEMQWAAPGDVLAGALRQMLQPSAMAAQILAPHARAMTDVTGFGLAGHLSEMLAEQRLGAQLDLTALPVLAGAEGLAAAGHASSLAPETRAALGAELALPETPRAALLVDPQTAGGLLAAVPMDDASALVTALRDVGYDAAMIGVVTAERGIRA